MSGGQQLVDANTLLCKTRDDNGALNASGQGRYEANSPHMSIESFIIIIPNPKVDPSIQCGTLLFKRSICYLLLVIPQQASSSKLLS